MAEESAELKRLRWRCSQRSMREMDVLLGGFIENHYAELSPEQVAAFTVLAEMEDIEIWPLVTGRKECPDAMLAEMVVMLRKDSVEKMK